MKMTLDEMKLAVCEKLPEIIEIQYGAPCIKSERRVVNWEWDGLKVCHEAEKLLDASQRESYRFLVTFESPYEQRLEALCRVWFPEKWS